MKENPLRTAPRQLVPGLPQPPSPPRLPSWRSPAPVPPAVLKRFGRSPCHPKGSALPPGAHAKGSRKISPRINSPALLGIQLSHRFDMRAKVGRYRRERRPKERERSAQAWTARLSLVSSFRPSLSCGLRRGRPTYPLFSSPFQHLSISAFQIFSFYLTPSLKLAKRRPRGKPLVLGEIHDLLPSI